MWRRDSAKPDFPGHNTDVGELGNITLTSGTSACPDSQNVFQFNRLAEGKTWAEAMASLAATGELPIHQAVQSYRPAEFSRYQADRGQDQHGLVSRPSSRRRGGRRLPPARDDSPCRSLGMRVDVRRTIGDD